MARTLSYVVEATGAPESVVPAILAEVGYAVAPDGRLAYRGIRVEDVAGRAMAFPEETAAVLAAVGYRIGPHGRARWGGRRGEGRPSAKLTENAVREIRAAKGAPLSELAARYGMTREAIRRARDRETWRHVI